VDDAPVKLSAEQKRPLVKALRDALGHDDVAMLVALLGAAHGAVVPANATSTMAVIALVEWAEQRDTVGELLVEARELNPTNAALRSLAGWAEVAVAVPEALERTVGADTSSNLRSWREGLDALEAQVCSIEGIAGGGGTGFLVGPDLVLTNHHVVAPVIDERVAPTAVRLRFDYKKDREGSEVRPGTIVGLHPERWLLDSSPHSAVDVQPGAVGRPGPDELDYAVLILDRPLGDDPGRALPGGARRGWIPFPAVAPLLGSGALAVILQHPNGRSLTIAFDTLLGVDDGQARTRVRYKIDTDNGSSGSPVFDLQWNLVALHHSGDPDYARDAEYNEGIPIDTIAALLRTRGHAERLGLR
jgi:hypothetical protein